MVSLSKNLQRWWWSVYVWELPFNTPLLKLNYSFLYILKSPLHPCPGYPPPPLDYPHAGGNPQPCAAKKAQKFKPSSSLYTPPPRTNLLSHHACCCCLLNASFQISRRFLVQHGTPEKISKKTHMLKDSRQEFIILHLDFFFL